MEAVDTPDVRDVTIEEGQPLTFTASFDTVPEFDPGDLSTIALHARRRTRSTRKRSSWRCSGCAIAARGTSRSKDAASTTATRVTARSRTPRRERHARHRTADVTIELGAKANPPGFDEQLLGLEAGAHEVIHASLSGRLPDWGARQHRRLVYSDGERRSNAASLPGARRRVREGSRRVRHARRASTRGCARISSTRRRHAAEREDRAELMKQLADAAALRRARVDGRTRDRSPARGLRPPADRSERRSAAGGHRLERVPRQPARGRARSGRGGAGARRGDPARAARGHRRGSRAGSRAATRNGPGARPRRCARRSRKKAACPRIYAGLRREKSIDFVMARATIAGDS